MNIQPISNNYSSSPNFKGIDAGKLLTKAANINSWQQRASLGIAAITLQPLIDSCNKGVDKETKIVSANRSFSKGFIGMITGIAVRGGCMKAVEGVLKNEKAVEGLAKITAENSTKEAVESAKNFIKNGGGAKKYAAVAGTILAIGVMIITNFAVDAPLTNFLTNMLNKKRINPESTAQGGNK